MSLILSDCSPVLLVLCSSSELRQRLVLAHTARLSISRGSRVPGPQQPCLWAAAAPAAAIKVQSGEWSPHPAAAPCAGSCGFPSRRKCPLCDLELLLSLSFLQQNKTALKVSVSSFCFTVFLPCGLSELTSPAGINTRRVSAEKTGEVEEARGGGVSICCWFTRKSEPAYHSIGCLGQIKDKGTSVFDPLLQPFVCLVPRLVSTALDVSNNKCQGEKGKSFCSSA